MTFKHGASQWYSINKDEPILFGIICDHVRLQMIFSMIKLRTNVIIHKFH